MTTPLDHILPRFNELWQRCVGMRILLRANN